MKIESNPISNIPPFKSDVDKLDDLPYIPTPPLPVKSFAMYLVGSPGSGKSSLMMSLLTSKSTKKVKRNRYYYKFFCLVHFISCSLQTLPNKFLKLLPDDHKHNSYSDELLMEIVDNLQEGDNTNNLIVLDDCIRDLSRSKILSKLYLNRRHATHNEAKDGFGGLSIMTTSQKYTLLPLHLRNACSDFIIFKTSNKTEIDRIQDELCSDLNSDEFETLIRYCWSEPYSFLYIKINNKKSHKYFKKFDRIIFDDED